MIDYKISKNKVVNFLLIILIGINIILINNYTKTGEQLNLSWSNTVGQFAEVAYGVTLDMDAIISNPLREEDVNNFYTTLRPMEKQLESLRAMPYSNEIIPNDFIVTMHNLLNYHRNVLSLIENDLKNKRKVSKDNVQRVRVLRQGWTKMVTNLYEEKNKINPFSVIFKKQTWKSVWTRGVESFDKIELIPLPDKQGQ